MRKSKTQKRTMRSILLNFVKNNGPQPYASLEDVVLTVAGRPLTDRHYGSAYIDRYSWGVSACLPTDADPAHLVQSPADGLYHYVAE